MTKIPSVTACEMAECGFNQNRKCHAAGIQVGDPAPAALHPRCDTFTPRGTSLMGAADLIANVGACMVDACTHNAQLRCTAEGIIVGHHETHADCKTFRARR